MYDLPYFKEQDPEKVKEFVRLHPFGTMIGVHEGRSVATQLPFLIEDRNGRTFLSAHMMKQTDHYHAFVANPSALCIFTGPDCYVSASWYSKPQSASTWNYMTVHMRGHIQFLNEEGLIDLLEKQTSYFENDPHSPASFHHLDPAYVQRLAKAIVAFEIEVTEMEHVFKLSQNHDQPNFQNIIRQLENRDANAKAVAAEMRKIEGQLFP